MDDFEENDDFITGGEDPDDVNIQGEEKDYEDDPLEALFRKGEGEDVQDPS